MKKKVITLVMIILITAATPAHAYYTVKSGDNLWKISQSYRMKYSDILTLNPQLQNVNQIWIGQHINVKSQDTATDITDYAQSLQGITTYQYGGQNAPYVTDCSGWTQYIYKQFGVTLPRVSKQQANIGTSATFQNMKKGDLMFFSTASDKTVNHVGIYLGNGYWISNLSSKQNVAILSIYGSWTQKYFLWAQRVI